MTEAELSQYRAIKNEIEDLSFRIKQLEEEKQYMSTTKVKGSLSEHPYIEVHYNVTGPDEEAGERRKNLINELYRKRNNKLVELLEMECRIHDYIYMMSDSTDRQIFTMRFIDGIELDPIGKKLHMDRRTVARRIQKYFEN